ncbi:hypothetical protein V6N13_064252 [Hibiscus sabdariffa]
MGVMGVVVTVGASNELWCSSVEAVGFLLLPRDRMSLKLMEVVTELKVNSERVMAMESDGGSNSAVESWRCRICSLRKLETEIWNLAPIDSSRPKIFSRRRLEIEKYADVVHRFWIVLVPGNDEG